ncbi:MAG: hypothetical protein ACI89R_000398 [Candidatus Azotimanducaceae bacterium]
MDTWIAQKFVLDFDNSVGEFYYDDTLIHTWVLNQNANGTAGDNTINAIDFYATAIGTSANTSAYYDDTAVAEQTLSTDEFQGSDSAFKIFPNPTNGFATLNLEMDSTNDINVAIFDITGRLVQSFNNINVTNREYSIDLSNLPNGVYLVRLMTNRLMKTKRVVVNK